LFNITTWVFEESSFRPAAKLTNDKKYAIVTDCLGTPTQIYDEKRQAVWAATATRRLVLPEELPKRITAQYRKHSFPK
jgi:hypothetical protein